MNIGSMKHRVNIEAPTLVPDGMGGFTATYTTIATSIAASIWSITANEQIQANASTMVVSHRIRMRYRSDIKANWRLKHENKYYNIVSIIDQNQDHRMLELLCKAV
jgi:SPP1 family predicted phage head-tail adaptor